MEEFAIQEVVGLRPTLGDVEKAYEEASKGIKRFDNTDNILIRVDGIAFHTYTKSLDKPCRALDLAMNEVALSMASRIQGCRTVYVQSDEISFWLPPPENGKSDIFFGGERDKMISAPASWAASGLTNRSTYVFGATKEAGFDGRAWRRPFDTTANYFVYRQRDAERNALSMLARNHFSHKKLEGKNSRDMKEMLSGIGIQWDDLPSHQRLGRVGIREVYEIDPKELPEKAHQYGVRGPVLRSRWVMLPETPRFEFSTNLNVIVSSKGVL